jgi:predicted DCC family thiol-disulfide oxidoreductase YuxK
MDETRILYNDTCPICRFEIEAYRRQATGLPLHFDPLTEAHRYGLTPDEAARRLHVMQHGQLLSGLEAFRAIWDSLPRTRRLARLTGLPVIRPVLAFLYDRIAAPVLYRAHLGRQRRPT